MLERQANRRATERRVEPAAPGLFGIAPKKSRLVIATSSLALHLSPGVHGFALVSTHGDILRPTRSASFAPDSANYVPAWSQNGFSSLFPATVSSSRSGRWRSLWCLLRSRPSPLLAILSTQADDLLYFFSRLAVPSVELHHPAVPPDGPPSSFELSFRPCPVVRSSNLPFSIFLFGVSSRPCRRTSKSHSGSTVRARFGSCRLIAPLSRPALAVVSMFIFNSAWDEFR